MLEITYGQKNFISLAWKEIDVGRPVALKVVGRKRPFVRRTLALYAEYDRLSRKGEIRTGVYLSLAWRTLFSPSFISLCNHAQSAGMAVAAYEEEEDVLEIRFAKPQTST